MSICVQENKKVFGLTIGDVLGRADSPDLVQSVDGDAVLHAFEEKAQITALGSFVHGIVNRFGIGRLHCLGCKR